MSCATCGAALAQGARFCSRCGAATALCCPQCGTDLAADARFCFHCGTVVSADPPAGVTPHPVSERRLTSVLFGDLVSFTSLSEARDPEEVRELLGRYFDTAREIVARYGGTIEKFIGDAVMAVWGVPVAHEDDAERAVRAGLDLTEAVSAFGESVGAPGLAMRVGVVTGEVAVTLGATNQGMVAGDAVNTAARVQAKAEPGQVWVDEQTRSLAGGSIDFRDVGWHELKGKQEAVGLFAATAVMGGVGGDRNSDRVQAPLVGRRRELSMLKEMFHAVEEERRPRLVVLSGEAGVGKTRLSWELENYIDGLSATVLWHSGRCLAYGDGVAFSALNAAVRGRIGATDDDSEASTREKLARSLATYVDDAAEREWLRTSLAGLLGIGDTRAVGRDDLFSAWLAWFESLSGDQALPVVWVVDDAHHADEGLLDFVEHLSTVARAPVLVVLLARPELLGRRAGLAAMRRASVIGLETLSLTDTTNLIESLVEGLPLDVRDELVQRAEGNPLFAIETVRAMHDQGLVVAGPTHTAGAMRLAAGVDPVRLKALGAPASLQVLVASRLDLLPHAERSVLAAAAVLGQTFTLGSLTALVEPGTELHDVLHELVARDLLTTVTDRLSADEGQYAFVQTVVRTVAYQTQSRHDRSRRHLAAASYLEPLADADGEVSTVIAQHLRDAVALAGAGESEGADLRLRLGGWLERSATRAEAVGAPSDAMRAYAEALTLVQEPSDVVRLHLAAAQSALDAGVMDRCVDYAGPLASGELSADRVDTIRAVVLAATALRRSYRVDQGWSLLEPHLTEDGLQGLPALVGSRLAREGSNYLDGFARFSEAIAWSEQALRLAEDSRDTREIVRSLNGLALGILQRGLPRVGMHVLTLAVELARGDRLTSDLALPLTNLLAFGLNHDLSASLAAAEEAMTVSEQSGDSNSCWQVALNTTVALTVSGRWDDVTTLLDRPLLQERPPEKQQLSVLQLALTVIAEARDDVIDVDALDRLANVAEHEVESYDTLYFVAIRAMHGRATSDQATVRVAARRLVSMALKYCGLEDDFPNTWALAVCWLVEAHDFDGARELLLPVSEVPASRRTSLAAAQLPRLRGWIEALDPESTASDAEVETDLLDGIAALEAFGAVPDRARAQATLGTWLIRRGRAAEAAPHLTAAREAFAALGANRWLRELDAELSLSAAG